LFAQGFFMRRISILKSPRTLFATLMTSTALVGIAAIAAHAADKIVDGGAVETITTTEAFDNVIVGNTGTGTLTIEGGGAMSDLTGNIGSEPGSTGTVTVTGTGSSWTNSQTLTIGFDGAGTLTISDGGAVSNDVGFIGRIAGSTGTATVTGANSTWTSSGNLIVGNQGTGTLTIADGGAVSNNGTGFIGSGGAGTVTVTGAGSTWTNSGFLLVGDEGAGSLTIESGGVVSNTVGVIGSDDGGTGTVTVTGAGSTWTNSSSLTVGNLGTGTLTIADGGTVNANHLPVFIASESGSTGTLNIGAAAGDTAMAAGTLNASTLTFGNGTGTLNFNHTNAAYDFDTAILGTATLNQIAGVTNLTADSSGFTGDINVTGGTLVVSNALVGSAVTVNGGTLSIEGGALSNATGVIGDFDGDTGTVSVTGSGSTWANSGSLTVGFEGNGTMTVADGGAVSNATGFIAREAGSTGTVTVTGTGSTWTNSGTLAVGGEGAGALTVADGGLVENATGIIGDSTSGAGAVTVTGANSIWTNTALTVGDGGAGTLTIADGGAVSSSSGFLGNESSSTGTVMVTGTGSTWTNTGELRVGNAAAGTFTIADGGAVSNNNASIGGGSNSTGTVTVTGAGSTWANSSDLTVGEFGTGTLTIESSGAVSNAFGIIGSRTGSTGNVTVTGTGSTWTNSGNMRVGGDGTGTLTIANGGMVDVVSGGGAVDIAFSNGSTGTLNIGAAAGSAAAAGTLNAATLAFGPGTGTLNFNHTGTGYNFDAAITGSGTINQIAGVTNLTADSSAFAGTTSITGGLLSVNGALGGGVTVSGGALGGSGTLGNLAIAAGSTIAPGNSIGTLNVTDISIDAGSTYEVEVNSAGASDLINATGTATINGGTVKVIAFPDFALDTAYTIVTAAGGISGVGTFDAATYGNGSIFITPTLTYDANNVFVTLAQTTDFADAAATQNQVAMAEGIASTGSGDVYDAILGLGTAAAAQGAFDALSGEIHASAKTALLEDSRFAREAALDRLRVALGGTGVGQATQEALEANAVWAQSFGSWSHLNTDGNAAALERSIGGLVMGANTKVTDNFALGLMGSYSRTGLNVADRASSATINGYTLGAYAGGTWDAVSLKGGVAHSWHSIDTSRSVAFTGFSDSLAASYNARALQTWGEAAYSFEAGAARFEPFANIAHVILSTDGFGEDGGAAALSAVGQTISTTFTTLGIRAEVPVELGETQATLSGGLGWRHAFGDTPTANQSLAGGNAFTVAGVSPARDALILDAGLTLNLTGSATLGLSYTGQLGSGISDHGAKASLNVRF
jgi:outer membrane autotransporter protein